LLISRIFDVYIDTLKTSGNTMSATPIKILGLSGSYGLTSKNGLLLSAALDECQKLGAEVHIWDLVEKPLPLVGAEGSWQDANVKEFQALATECDGYILTSPEYHGTMSGVMKNTLDWVYKDHVGGKAFGLMSTLGGISNSNTLNHMRIAVRWIHGWCVPEQVAVGKVKEAFDEDNNLTDTDVAERVVGLAQSVVSAAIMLKDNRE
jgi:FMN reductase